MKKGKKAKSEEYICFVELYRREENKNTETEIL